MRKLIFPAAICVVSLLANAQAENEKQPFPFNEIGVSANYTFGVSREYTATNSVGGGIGLYHRWRENTNVNPVAGLEYNFTRFRVQDVPDRTGYLFDELHFRYHQLRIPLGVRLHIGGRTTFFLEPGVFFDLRLAGVYTGEEENLLTDERAKRTVRLRPGLDCGFSLGVGVQVPCKAGELLFKVDASKGMGRTTLAGGSPGESAIFYNSFARCSVIFRRKA